MSRDAVPARRIVEQQRSGFGLSRRGVVRSPTPARIPAPDEVTEYAGSTRTSAAGLAASPGPDRGASRLGAPRQPGDAKVWFHERVQPFCLDRRVEFGQHPLHQSEMDGADDLRVFASRLSERAVV
jgi:hypothetical protein